MLTLYRHFTQIDDIDAKASKLLYLKRSDLYPILDQKLLAVYGTAAR